MKSFLRAGRTRSDKRWSGRSFSLHPYTKSAFVPQSSSWSALSLQASSLGMDTALPRRQASRNEGRDGGGKDHTVTSKEGDSGLRGLRCCVSSHGLSLSLASIPQGSAACFLTLTNDEAPAEPR